MQLRQGNTAKSLRAVQDFLDTHASKFPSVAASGARKKLGDAVTELEAQATIQHKATGTVQNGTRRTRALARRLRRNHMAPIARVARNELPWSDALLPLRLPAGDASIEQLAVAARGMAEAAAPHASIFIDSALPVDFIVQLEAALDAMLRSVDLRERDKSRLSGATSGLRVTIQAARRAVDILDGVVRVALEDDPALLAEWNKAKSVQRSRSAAAPVDASLPVAA